jgi:Ca2+-binding EF-hand superfamily protein
MSFFKLAQCDCVREGKDPDPLVDISNMFCVMVNKNDIEEGHFLTYKSHRDHLEHQTIAYGELSHSNTFWLFVSDQNRIATLPQHHKIEDFIRLGIPPTFRSKLWRSLTGTTVTPERFNQYRDLLQMERRQDYTHQIELDVIRTFSSIRDPTFSEKLTRVLMAYANRNPSLGYCQSMNVLAGTLLLFMEEEHAFWVLVYLIEDLLANYHSLTLSGFLADAEFFKWLVADNLPELHKHFQSLNFDIVGLTAPWFLSLYVHELPLVTAFFVWDNIMLEGTYAIFEVGLALLRMQQEELLRYENEVELIVHIRTFTKQLYNPKKLINHWQKLDTEKVAMYKHRLQNQSEEEVARVAHINSQFNEIATATHFDTNDLKNLWRQYTIIFPFLCSPGVGLDFKRFSQFIGGTFREWWVDRDLVERLYSIVDLNKDGTIDFPELVTLLSLMCRGTFSELVQLNFRLFDVKGKGWVDKFDLARMLQSIYGVFRDDKKFNILLRNFVNNIFEFPAISFSGVITVDTFQYVVLVQPQILERFTMRNPRLKYNPKNTYFYWMNMNRPDRDKDIVHIALDQQAALKQGNVPLPAMFGGSVNFAVS